MGTNTYAVSTPTLLQSLESWALVFGGAITPAAIATHSHLFALTASHFLSDATKSNQKTLRSRHPAPALRSGVPSLRSCSREYALQAPSLGPQRLTGIHARHLPPHALRSAS